MENRIKSRDVKSISPAMPDLEEALELTTQSVAALFGPTHRTISSMPIVVSYNAKIALVKQVDRDDEITFLTTRAVDGKVGEESWTEEHLDAYKIRDEFLQVGSPRQALDFLRDTGEFLPYADPISWKDFLRWQNLAEIVIEHKSLAALVKAMFAGQPKEDLDPSGELEQILKLLTGEYQHTYFKKEEWQPSSEELASIKRSSEETPRQAERMYMESLQAIEKGRAIKRERQQGLESWFYAPPPSSYSIELAPRNPTAEFIQNMRRGGALVDYVHPLEDLFPTLVIRPSCTLHAIAASIYADRIAGVRSGKCPGCGKWFEVESQKTKKYCGDTCRERLKKQRLRASS